MSRRQRLWSNEDTSAGARGAGGAEPEAPFRVRGNPIALAYSSPSRPGRSRSTSSSPRAHGSARSVFCSVHRRHAASAASPEGVARDATPQLPTFALRTRLSLGRRVGRHLADDTPPHGAFLVRRGVRPQAGTAGCLAAAARRRCGPRRARWHTPCLRPARGFVSSAG